MDNNKSSLFIVAIVAVVAVVSLFLMNSGQQVVVSEDWVVSESEESSALAGQAWGRGFTPPRESYLTKSIEPEEPEDPDEYCVETDGSGSDSLNIRGETLYAQKISNSWQVYLMEDECAEHLGVIKLIEYSCNDDGTYSGATFISCECLDGACISY